MYFVGKACKTYYWREPFNLTNDNGLVWFDGVRLKLSVNLTQRGFNQSKIQTT